MCRLIIRWSDARRPSFFDCEEDAFYGFPGLSFRIALIGVGPLQTRPFIQDELQAEVRCVRRLRVVQVIVDFDNGNQSIFENNKIRFNPSWPLANAFSSDDDRQRGECDTGRL